ncbi:MAG: hypothetical protein N3A69_01015 [Leptospiraceae bacterium]|nr:hypothetical protein [Leptospiraceae bacterium]
MKRIFLTILLLMLTSPLFAQAKGSKGLVLKGGLWGLGNSFKSQYESIRFTDSLLAGFGFGELNLDWEKKSNDIYLLNPIGFDFYLPAGPGALQLGFEARGLPFAPGAFGFNPKYEYISLNPPGIIGLHNADVKFRNYDYTIGYQIPVAQFLITPKFVIRDFANEFKDDSFYFGNNFFGIGKMNYKSPGYASFIGVNLLFDINGTSGIFLDMIFTSPLQIPLPQIGELFATNMKYTQLFLTNGVVGYTFRGRGTQVITGQRFLLGYQHKFGNLALQIGYHSETLNSRYDGNFELPITIVQGADRLFIDVNEIISNRFITYDQQNKTELKSLYLTLLYNL